MTQKKKAKPAPRFPAAPPLPTVRDITPAEDLGLDLMIIQTVADKMLRRVVPASKSDVARAQDHAQTDLVTVGPSNAEEFLIAGRGLLLILARLDGQVDALKAAL